MLTSTSSSESEEESVEEEKSGRYLSWSRRAEGEVVAGSREREGESAVGVSWGRGGGVGGWKEKEIRRLNLLIPLSLCLSVRTVL